MEKVYLKEGTNKDIQIVGEHTRKQYTKCFVFLHPPCLGSISNQVIRHCEPSFENYERVWS